MVQPHNLKRRASSGSQHHTTKEHTSITGELTKSIGIASLQFASKLKGQFLSISVGARCELSNILRSGLPPPSPQSNTPLFHISSSFFRCSTYLNSVPILLSSSPSSASHPYTFIRYPSGQHLPFHQALLSPALSEAASFQPFQTLRHHE